jgi:DNA-directed RNA polymerase subunit M/transcription elongation factor TFIIS
MRTVENPEHFRSTIKTTLNTIIQDTHNSNVVENGIYNYTIQECTNRKIIKKWNNPYFVEIYISKFKTLFVNLKSEYVQELVKKDPTKIAYLSHMDFNPDKWKTLIEKQNQINESMLNKKLKANTDQFKCRKCDGRNCNYYQLQIRSADEPMTSFITCIDCEHKWKVN